MPPPGKDTSARVNKESQIKIRVTSSLRDHYDVLAAERGEAVAVLVREALHEYLERQRHHRQQRRQGAVH